MTDPVILNIEENNTEIVEGTDPAINLDLEQSPIEIEIVEQPTTIEIVEQNITIIIASEGLQGPSGVSERETRDIDSDYTIVDSDSVILANSSAGDLDVLLPSAVGRRKKILDIKKMHSNNVVYILAQSGEQVEFTTSLELYELGVNVSLISNGVAWFLL